MKPSFNLPVDFSQAEHFVLEGSEAQTAATFAETLALDRPRPLAAALERFELRDRLTGRQLAIEIFEGGMLKLLETARGQSLREERLDLRYLDPAATLVYRRPRRSWRIAAGLAALGLVGLGLAATTGQAWLWLLGGMSVPASALAAWVSARRTGEDTVFTTRHGRAPALRWQASFGCLRRSRKLRPRIAAAIEQARRHPHAERTAELRAEMREHYRLKDEGILSGEECAAAARRILAAFD